MSSTSASPPDSAHVDDRLDWSGEPARERRRFAWLVTAACLLLTAPRLLLHELWRDEAWLWLVATESRSLADLLPPLSRSGQGYLFPLLCYLVGQVWASPRAMQLIHLVLAAAAASVQGNGASSRRRSRRSSSQPPPSASARTTP